MKPLNRNIIVRVDSQYNDTVTLDNVVTLYFDPEYRRTHNIKYDAIVEAVPEGKTFDYHGKEIDPVIQVGDKAYFRYVMADGIENVVDKSITDTSSSFSLRLHYSDIICVVRDGVITPTCGWCLGTPVIDGAGEYAEIEGHLMKVEYLKGTDIIISQNGEKSTNKAIVKYISTFVGEESSLSINDEVFCNRPGMINFENNIEGVDYYCFKEEYIDAIL